MMQTAARPRAAGLSSRAEKALWLVALLAALAFSRGVLEPRYLITFDEINFAHSIGQFNPALDQPQPPGYPIFVGLLKFVSLAVQNVQMVFLVSGLAVSATALLLAWRLGELMVPGRGVISALLLLFNPAFWLAALTNPVRLCLAAGATLVALCLWLACRSRSIRWFSLAAAGLGLSAGARPELALLMAPLLLWTAVRIRLQWRGAVVSVLCYCVAASTWLPSLLSAAGGWQKYLRMLEGYSGAQFADTSPLFGAFAADAVRMAWRALVWSCLGALSWLWAVPIVMRRASSKMDAFSMRFLAVWFFPGLAFNAIVHTGDPDHMLSIIPATCAAGMIVIAALTREASQTKYVLTISTCILLNLLLFFKPISKATKASTYPPVRWMDGYIADIIDEVRSLRESGPVTAVFAESTTGWRQLSYYEPAVDIIVLQPANGDPVTTRHILGKQVVMQSHDDRIVKLPSRGALVWVDPLGPPATRGRIPMHSIHSRVFSTRAASGGWFEFRGAYFSAPIEACAKTTIAETKSGRLHDEGPGLPCKRRLQNGCNSP